MTSLAVALTVPLAHAVGCMEAMIHFAAQYCPQGDIGKWPNPVIATGCLWDGDADKFVTSMLSVGFFDENDALRLVIHDWNEHADNTVQKYLDEHKLKFWNGVKPFNKKKIARTSPRPTKLSPGSNSVESGLSLARAHAGERLGKARLGKAPAIDTVLEEKNGFDRFWQAYPRKIAKQAAKNSWDKVAPDQELESLILAAIEKQRKTNAWTKDGGQFIPHPSTWLNQHRWEDEITAGDMFSQQRTVGAPRMVGTSPDQYESMAAISDVVDNGIDG